MQFGLRTCRDPSGTVLEGSVEIGANSLSLQEPHPPPPYDKILATPHWLGCRRRWALSWCVAVGSYYHSSSRLPAVLCCVVLLVWVGVCVLALHACPDAFIRTTLKAVCHAAWSAASCIHRQSSDAARTNVAAAVQAEPWT